MPNEHKPEDRDRQTDAAAELAERAAESVDRRYDATKETHLGEPHTDEEREDKAEEEEDEEDPA
jgi:hypothetical protein